ncbi:MAG: methionyl-tRNA formyltransferase [Planctomycetota bacterium]
MRILFLGTPEFARRSLDALMASTHEVVHAICQPARPVGRGRKRGSPPIAETCVDCGIPLSQPEKLKRSELEALLRDTRAEAGVVVAYGKILRKWLLDSLPFGFLNVHASILPKYRGAAPVARAIIAGERETGVSIMQLDEGMDTGPVFCVKRTPIDLEETAGELMARLAGIGAEALIEVLDGLAAGTRKPKPQEGEGSLAPSLVKEDGRIRWEASAREIHDRIRGVNPWPGGTALFRDGEVRVWRSSLSPEGGGGDPGEIQVARKTILRVATGEGSVDLRELQLPGKKRVQSGDFINGTHVKAGERFL